MTPKQLDKWNEKFKELDKNGDGFITLQEFIRGMRASSNNVCMTDSEFREVFQEIDTDGNYAIDLTEFLAKKTREKEKKVRNIFRRADNNVALRQPWDQLDEGVKDGYEKDLVPGFEFGNKLRLSC